MWCNSHNIFHLEGYENEYKKRVFHVAGLNDAKL